MLNQYNGENSVAIRHEQEARLEAVRESDEGGLLPECPACGERTMETVYLCKAANSLVTSYCYTQGKRGCIWRMTDRCAQAKQVKRCTRCEHIEEI